MSVEQPGAPAPSEFESLYEHALSAMQNGQWLDAQQAVTALERQYPRSPEVQGLRQALRLHLSAEENWAAADRRSPSSYLRVPRVRVLAIANLVIYLLLAAMWLLIRYVRTVP